MGVMPRLFRRVELVVIAACLVAALTPAEAVRPAPRAPRPGPGALREELRWASASEDERDRALYEEATRIAEELERRRSEEAFERFSEDVDRLRRDWEEKERRRPWLYRAMERVDIPHAIVILMVIGWVAFGVVPRTVYGLWWRRSWPKVLIVGGAGIAALEVFQFLQYPPRADRAMFAVGAMMLVGGALSLRRPKSASSPTGNPRAQGRDTEQTRD